MSRIREFKKGEPQLNFSNSLIRDKLKSIILQFVTTPLNFKFVIKMCLFIKKSYLCPENS